tara:strand:- start:185 stop:334 length:150 start_codon:yes stop_codon:yes gene_type:complete
MTLRLDADFQPAKEIALLIDINVFLLTQVKVRHGGGYRGRDEIERIKKQ